MEPMVDEHIEKSKQMKIGFSCCALGDGKTGIAIYEKNLLQSLQKVDIYNNYDILIGKGDEDFISIHAPYFREKIYSSFFKRPLANIFWHHLFLPLIAIKEHYDLVHIPTFRRVPLIKGCPVIATIHDLAPFVVSHKYDRWRMFYHHHVLSKLIYRCDHVIAVSHHTKEDIIRFTGYPEKKITVIYPGINQQLFQPVPQQEAQKQVSINYQIDCPFIVYVSRIEHPGKNHLHLIKAFELFKKKTNSPHELIFAGADWSGAEVVKEYAARSPFKKAIHFLGYVPQEMILNLYSACDLMAFPSYYEGFGFPILEAMACGAPVISARTSSLEEIGGDHVLFFDPENIEQMSQCIEQGLLPSYREKVVKGAKEHSSHFDWDKTAQKVLEVYERVYAKR